MECATVSCDQDEFCTMLNSSRPTAGIAHKCTECNREIVTGETYLRETTIFDGNVETWKTCADCESLRDTFFRDGFFFGEIFERLFEHIDECGGDISESTIATLTPKAREAICEMIDGIWGNSLDSEEDEEAANG